MRKVFKILQSLQIEKCWQAVEELKFFTSFWESIIIHSLHIEMCFYIKNWAIFRVKEEFCKTREPELKSFDRVKRGVQRKKRKTVSLSQKLELSFWMMMLPEEAVRYKWNRLDKKKDDSNFTMLSRACFLGRWEETDKKKWSGECCWGEFQVLSFISLENLEKGELEGNFTAILLTSFLLERRGSGKRCPLLVNEVVVGRLLCVCRIWLCYVFW